MTGPVMSTEELHDYIASVAGKPSLAETLALIQELRDAAVRDLDLIKAQRLESAAWHLTRLQMILSEGE